MYIVDNYAQCYGKNKLPFGEKPALVVIDAVKAYHTPGCPLYAPERFDKARDSIVRLIDEFRRLGLPVIFTSVIFNARGLSEGKWYKYKLPNVLNAYDEGNPMREFAEGVVPREDEVIVYKQYSSSFFGTSLASLLTSMGIDTTVCIGYSTSGCVRATTLDAMQHGFCPFVVREACGDRHESVNDNNLFDMDQKFAEVVTEAWMMKTLREKFAK
ncbi:isochorismatase hydrolase [Mytilinidion resinicola]|uniref:Isochorismatase hydrolase n=1 Tax=Mytilinidion resinicola TaxID=574789 RepID=A0A6A6YIX9_9PEZI|nr:isochorismatase hydrolase [Mytilinidion resinicola]KAF2808750.1 isochorismatase hydrolase [Mytilinidion resinicola]